ncbi:MAG: PDZ domain-containing protein [Planctomycetes bacterium]|nr:PDZ domain-containing protein [Planctomycetota bacterium]
MPPDSVRPTPVGSTTSAIALGAVLALLCGWPLVHPTSEPAEVLAARVLRTVEKHYVEEVDGQELLRNGLDRIVRGLDRNSRYFSPEQALEFEQETGGYLVGIGVILREDEQLGHLIERVIPDGPASAAGIVAGDQIVAVDGDSATDWNLAELSQRLRGAQKTRVEIGLQRAEENTTLSVDRGEVHIPSVTEIALFAFDEDSLPKTGLVRLRQFQPNSTTEVKNAIEKVVDAGATAIVLDLRGNAGGLFTEAVSISSLFLDAGDTVVKTRGRAGIRDEQVTSVKQSGPFAHLPLAILIDASSASASEIVAAALRDHRRAALIGDASFGKWTAQDLIYIPSGSEQSLLKLTTQSFHPPEGIRVGRDELGNAAGLIPDVAVTTNPETALQIALNSRSRAFARIEQPASVARLSMPDAKVSVDQLGNGDAVLSAALELLSQTERWRTLLEKPTPSSKKESR